MSETLYDTVAVNFTTNIVQMMGVGKTRKNADAIEEMAIMRRGVEECWYTVVEAGKYKDGDTWSGQ
jgi:hypothetical protein